MLECTSIMTSLKVLRYIHSSNNIISDCWIFTDIQINNMKKNISSYFVNKYGVMLIHFDEQNDIIFYKRVVYLLYIELFNSLNDVYVSA